MSVTRTRSKAVGAVAVALLLTFAGTAEAANGLRMSGWWTQRFGSIFIPQGVSNPFVGDTIAGDAVVRVTDLPGGPAGVLSVTLSRSAFQRPVIQRNGAIPQAPQFVQLFSSFAFRGPESNNNTSVPTPYAGVLRPARTSQRNFSDFTFCPGATTNPACLTHKTIGQGAPVQSGTIHGKIRYTAHNPSPFGGALRMLIAGSGALSTVIAGAAGTPAAQISHAPIGGGGAQQAQVVGGAYDGRNTVTLGQGVVTTGAVLSAPDGVIIAPGVPIGLGASVTNRNVGLPFTAGTVYVRATVINGIVTKYTAMGYDNRNSVGVGNLQLVAAGVTKGLASGKVFQRVDVVNMEFSAGNQTPAISPTGMVALGSLLVLGGGYVLRRRLS